MPKIANACILAVALAAAVAAQEAGEVFRYPAEDEGLATLEARRAAQLRTLDRFEVFTGFSFQDQVASSGIAWEHHSVEDSAKNWQPAHYDHGNGVAVADVDGDQLLDIYFVTQLGSNGLYRNLGGGRFEDITERAGLAIPDRVGVAASFADADNDGDADLYVTSVRHGNAFFVNDGTGRFRDATAEAGLEYSGHSSGAVFFDYDRDGLLDLFLVNVGVYTNDQVGPGGFYRALPDAFKGHLFPERTERSILYRNEGGLKFRNVSQEVGLVDEGWSGDASLTDFDGDRDPDLYVLNMQGDNHYWENEGGRFVEKTASFFPRTPWGAMGIKFFDWNNDGRLDLYLTDMHSDMHDQPVDPLADEKRKYDVNLPDGANNIYGNAFYERQVDGSFREVSDIVGAENYWPWGLSAADLNADGWEDAFIASSMAFPFRYAFNSVLLNNRGKTFLDSEFILGVEPRRDGRSYKPLFVVDCGGADREHMLCGRFQLTGAVTVHGALGTRSSAILDLEEDGDLDIVTSEFNDVPQVLVSDLAQKRPVRYLEVALRGTRSNRDGLGALVTVKAGGNAYVKLNDGKSGYLSQSRQPLYFGLGESERIESVEVLWPSGARQTVSEGIQLNSRLEVVEEGPAAPEA